MSEQVNLSDPNAEPTDEQLVALSVRAFAHVPAARRDVLCRLRREIAAAREEALRLLEAPHVSA